MKPKLHPYEKAGRVIRLMAWLSVLSFAAIGVAVVTPAIATGHPLPVEFIALGVVLLLIPLSLFVIARGVFKQRDWARWAGMGYAVLALFGIPIGTIVGFYVLWQLQKGWPEKGATSDLPAHGRIEPRLE
jgi:membrane protein YdbS with pleckstrin-like domain